MVKQPLFPSRAGRTAGHAPKTTVVVAEDAAGHPVTTTIVEDEYIDRAPPTVMHTGRPATIAPTVIDGPAGRPVTAAPTVIEMDRPPPPATVMNVPSDRPATVVAAPASDHAVVADAPGGLAVRPVPTCVFIALGVSRLG